MKDVMFNVTVFVIAIFTTMVFPMLALARVFKNREGE